ncbi:MAG TPA: FUSC family protein [Reyranella sp.]|nr:FUSC family protein [Reyranella sp.]
MLWRWLRTFAVRYRTQLALSVRVSLAAVVALVVAQRIGLPLPLWAVLTAVIVTQMSVGRSLKATADYLIGTLGGSVYGGVVAVVLPHTTELGLLAVMIVAVAPLALVAAIRPNMNVVPITAIIVLLLPSITHGSPVESAVYRVLEVTLGAVIGLAVSFVVFPSSAHRLIRRSASHILDLMARALAALLAGLARGLDDDELHRLQDGIGQGLTDLNAIGAEAERERRARLSSDPDTGPLRRTLLRLRHDLVIVGRAAGTPLPASMQARLAPPLSIVASAAADFLSASGRALVASAEAPSLERFEKALEAYDREVEAARREGLTRVLSADAAERFFAVGFALEQMHDNLKDLQRVVREWGPQPEEELVALR